MLTVNSLSQYLQSFSRILSLRSLYSILTCEVVSFFITVSFKISVIKRLRFKLFFSVKGKWSITTIHWPGIFVWCNICYFPESFHLVLTSILSVIYALYSLGGLSNGYFLDYVALYVCWTPRGVKFYLPEFCYTLCSAFSIWGIEMGSYSYFFIQNFKISCFLVTILLYAKVNSSLQCKLRFIVI